MEDFAELTLEGVPYVADNYEKVYHPVKNKAKQGVQKAKGIRESRQNGRGGYESEDDFEDYDAPPPRRSKTGGSQRSPPYEARRRSDRGDVVEERRAYRGPGRARSAGRGGNLTFTVSSKRAISNRLVGARRDYSDSESSMSPPRRRRKSLGEKALVALGLGGAAGATSASAGKERDRRRSRSRSKSRSRRNRSVSSDYARPRRDDRSRGSSRPRAYDDDRTPARYKPGYAASGGGSENGNNQVARRDDRSAIAKRDKKDSSSSESSSDVCSSSEDERRTRKMKGKEYLTAGLAAVATIHAAHNVYNSMEARDKRQEQVYQGEITPEDARKLKNKARLQDAAAIGIAALGIKGAYSEWKEVQENRHELAEQEKAREERHEKRVKKAAKYGGRNRSEPDLGRRRRDDRDYR